MTIQPPENHARDGHDSLHAPPRWLLWGLVALFILAIAGGITGVWIFRDVLRPSQQQRVMDMLPFMRAFMRGGEALPTPELQLTSTISAMDLLNSPLEIPTSTPTATAEIAASPTAAPTQTLPPDATTLPSATPTPTENAPLVSPTPAPTQVGSNLPTSARMFGFSYVRQDWNNCGPANITMALSYFGWQEDMAAAVSYLKTDREDKNVSPIEMVNFVNEETGVRAITRIGGDLDVLRALIATNFPVVIETGYMFEGYDWIGHYRTLVAYDDLQQIFYIYDSFLGSGGSGEGFAESYAELDRHWQAFNRTFIVLYQQERENELRAVLGDLADPTMAAEHALATAQEEARANPQNSFAWFNMGTAFVRLSRYEEAAAAYDRARQVTVPQMPWRMLWYQFGMYEAYYEVGRYDDILSLVTANLTNGGQYVEETFYWQGRAYLAQGQDNLAAESFRRALANNSHFDAAREALEALSS
ncbi:MAG: C39 family peptidase [Chloroflexi bacterium]|nr:C39 family peptidase [Chloroflexota bacterium]